MGNKGVTLLEVVVVLAVTAIIMNILSVSFSDNGKRKLNATVIKLQEDLRYARRMAMTEGKVYSVNLDTERNKYDIRYYLEGSSSRVVIKTVYLTDGISIKNISASPHEVEYGPKGTTLKKAKTITLENEDYTQSFTVNLGVGRVDTAQPVKKIK